MAAICLGLACAAHAADPFAYAVQGDGQFGTVDLANGNYTNIAFMTEQLSGLGAASDGSIYGTQYFGHDVDRVDKTTGAITVLSTDPGITWFDTGSTVNGTVYAIDTSINLYSINTTTGAATLIGATGLVESGYWGMSASANGLYLAHSGSFYSINTSTAALTLIGTSSPAYIGAMVYTAGQLYAGAENPHTIQTVDPTTGLATFVSNSDAPNAFYGLAQAPSLAPEPGSFAVLGLGVLGFLVRRKRTLVR